jgi:hypothetical protein
MSVPSAVVDRAFRDLERALAARRLAALDVRDRVVVLVLATLASGFVYWQVRVPLDGFRRAHGPEGAALALAVVLLGFALLAAALAAWKQAAMSRRAPGPEWLALPVAPARVGRHLLTEARVPALAAFPPAAAALATGAGLVPPGWIALLAAGFAVAWLEGTRAGAAIARRVLAVRAADAPGLPAATRALLALARGVGSRPLPPATWRREPAWRAIARLDALASRRASASRTRLATAALWLLAGLGAWLVPAPAPVRRALAFAAFASGCAALGAWAIARTCADPPEVTRPLPLSWRDLYRARATAIALFAGTSLLAHTAFAAAQAPGPGFAIGPALLWPLPGFAIAVLGLHYGLTLGTRARAAENLYYGWLGVALASSLMIPLVGWVVLLAGVIMTARRLPRWWRPEVE